MRRFLVLTALVLTFILFANPVALAMGPVPPPPQGGELGDPSQWFDTGYAYGYWSDGRVDWGYNTYRTPIFDDPAEAPQGSANPLKDLQGARPNGSLLKVADDPTVFFIQEGTFRPISSAAVFRSWGFDWNSIMTVPESVLSMYPYSLLGTLGFRPGTLVQMHRDPAIYSFGFDQMWHLIPDMATFTSFGFDLSDVMTIGFPDYVVFPTGSPLATAVIPAGGSAVKNESDATVYVWDDTPEVGLTLWAVVSPAAFESWNLSWNSILTMSDFEFNAWATDPGTEFKPMWMMPGTLVKSPDDPSVFVADYLLVQTKEPQATIPTGTTWEDFGPLPGQATVSGKGPAAHAFTAPFQFVKRLIVSPSAFESQQYQWNAIVTESAGILTAIPAGREITE